MDVYSPLDTLYSMAEGYGIPAYAVNVVLTFALVLLLGRPLISFFLRVSYRRISELSPETRSSYVGIIHIVAIVVTALSAFLDLRLAGALSFVFLVVMPIAVGFVASKREREKTAQSSKQTALKQALKGKKREAKPGKASETALTRKKFRFPPLPLPKIPRMREPKKEKKEHRVKPTRREKTEQKGPALIVEEITFGEGAAHVQKKIIKSSSSRAETPKQIPPAETVRVKEFRKAVDELETIAGGQRVVTIPAPPSTSIDESALVKEIEKAVEERVVRARRHKFITWREVLEMKRRAKETVKRMEPVVKERVRQRLQEKGTITKEDLNEIAEEILYQIQKSETPATPSKETKKTKAEEVEKKKIEKKERPRRRRREKKKKGDEEDLLIGGGEGEDLLALLGEEESEEDIGSDLEELEKLLGEG